MSILSILFFREERGMIRKAVMMAWECEHPPGPNVLPTDVKFPNRESHWDNNDAVHQGYRRDLRDFITKGIQKVVP
jgi:hypothetical protein